MARTLRITLVDDRDLVHSDSRMILDAQKDMCIVGQTSDSVGVLLMVKATQPDIALMDIRIPTLDGISTTCAVLGSHPGFKMLILTTFDLDDYLMAVMWAGASGFLPESPTAHELLADIHAAVRGDLVVAPPVTRRLLKRWFVPACSTAGPAGPSELGTGTMHTESINVLSDQEKEIVTLVGRAMSNTEIARHFVLAESATKSCLNRTLHKPELRDWAQPIALAYKSELVRVGE